MQPQVTQVLQDSYSLIDEYKSKEDDGTIDPVGANDPKHIFRDKPWN